MPIEIKELYIKINVDEGARPTDKKSPKSGKSDILAACVEETMERIREQKER